MLHVWVDVMLHVSVANLPSSIHIYWKYCLLKCARRIIVYFNLLISARRIIVYFN